MGRNKFSLKCFSGKIKLFKTFFLKPSLIVTLSYIEINKSNGPRIPHRMYAIGAVAVCALNMLLLCCCYYQHYCVGTDIQEPDY